MPANECIPFYEPGERITADASATITGKRFVKISANIEAGPGLNTGVAGGNIRCAPADALGRAFGVAAHDCATDDKVAILTGPGMVVPVVADGSIAAFAEVEVGTAGKAKSKTNSGQAVGLCLTAAADGEDAMIMLLAPGSAPGEPGSGNEYAQGTQQAFIADPSVTGAAASVTGTMTSVAITGGEDPTEAEFNTLVSDVTDLYTTVIALAADTADLYTSLASTNSKVASIIDVLIEYGQIAAS